MDSERTLKDSDIETVVSGLSQDLGADPDDTDGSDVDDTDTGDSDETDT